jgi:hypothetical protein
MSISYPVSLDTFTNPQSTDTQSAVPHATQHSNANDAITALETKVGVNSSAVTTTHDYKLSEVTDKAVGKTATQTLTNKTLTSPQINMGSDANGDMYIRNGSGVTSRLAAGTTGQILNIDSVTLLPAWVANPAAADASTTVKGVSEKATTAEITAGTSTGGTGAQLFIGADAVGAVGASKIVQFNSSTQYPAADGSLITNLTAPTCKSGVTTRDLSTASGNQTIAHGLGKTPKMVELTVIQASTSGASDNYSFGMYDSSTNSGIYRGQNSNSQYYVGNSSTYCINIYTSATTDTSPSTASATVDGTNITLAWTRATSATGTAQIFWRVI